MQQHQYPLIFGEVLFDIFDNKTEKLGGAPFNVAWHLQGFGLNPVFVSSIGTDYRGVKIKAAIEKWGLSTIGIQKDPKHPTGKVSVTTGKNDHRFQIHDDVAYDYIDGDNLEKALMARDYSLLYHGTLALRHRLSRVALHILKKRTSSNIFLDVNLRSPWWNPVSVFTELKAARWAKCNEEELFEIAKISNIKTEALADITFSVLQRYGI